MTVRPATHADIPQLVELMHEFYAESSFPLEREWAASAFGRLLDDASAGAVWIMEDGSAPVGHVVLTVRFTMEYGGPSGYIDDLFVRPVYRRKGAARAGLNALVADCRRRGLRSLQVEVGLGNDAAQALYRHYVLTPADDDRQSLRVVLDHAGGYPPGSRGPRRTSSGKNVRGSASARRSPAPAVRVRR